MSWSIGILSNSYSQAVGIQIFAGSSTSVDYSTAPIRGGNINVIIPLRGTLAFVDVGKVQNSSPQNGIEAYFLDKTWSFRYDQTTKLHITIDSSGNPTVHQDSSSPSGADDPG